MSVVRPWLAPNNRAATLFGPYRSIEGYISVSKEDVAAIFSARTPSNKRESVQFSTLVAGRMGSLSSSNASVEVSLRKFTAADMEASAKWFGDDEVTVTTPNDSLRSDAELEHYFATTIAPHPWYRLICVNGVPAGAIYLTMGVKAHAVRGDLSYILAKEYWGMGVVTQATRLAVQAGFQQFRLARIQAYALTTNIASHRVLEKCGFQREGLLRNFVQLHGTVLDVFIFGIYQDLTAAKP